LVRPLRGAGHLFTAEWDLAANGAATEKVVFGSAPGRRGRRRCPTRRSDRREILSVKRGFELTLRMLSRGLILRWRKAFKRYHFPESKCKHSNNLHAALAVECTAGTRLKKTQLVGRRTARLLRQRKRQWCAWS
jgi:hypothetical protein